MASAARCASRTRFAVAHRHSFRAIGITIYLANGGVLEKAQRMAAHESPRTIKLYDRTSDAVSLDAVERVVF
jgi:hypothetical protein